MQNLHYIYFKMLQIMQSFQAINIIQIFTILIQFTFGIFLQFVVVITVHVNVQYFILFYHGINI